MKVLVLNILLSSFFINTVSSQQDVTNWGNVEWNSTIEQIETKFQDKLVKLKKIKRYSNEMYCQYILEDYQAFNSHFNVHFLMDSITNQLKTVLLISKNIKSYSNIEPSIGLMTYNNILKSMKIEYGEPNVNKNEESTNNSEWFFNSSIVSLNYLHIQSVDFLSLNIRYSESSKNTDFRQVKWGFPKEQVRKSENLLPIIDTNNMIIYKTSIAEMNCIIGYVFVNNKLTRARYIFEEKHTNKNDYLVDYYELKGLLNKKYGSTFTQNDENWRNNLYKDDIQQKGFAISLGHLTYSSFWKSQKTNISLWLTGENYKITLVIEYKSKEFEDLEEESTEEQILRDF